MATVAAPMTFSAYYLTDSILDSAMGRDNEHLIAEETRVIYDGKPLRTESGFTA